MRNGFSLPIDVIEDRLIDTLEGQPVVVTSPTGSGKSTQVPRWCQKLGPVLVVEPRRVACRGLASRVAELERVKLGQQVGYVVRQERRASRETRILFATPGVVLRWMADGSDRRLQQFAVVIIDEFHERSLDVDLLLGLLLGRFGGHLVVMSATMEGDRVAAHVGGACIAADGRMYPVECSHVPGRAMQPESRGLEDRLVEALDRAREDPGDVLVFLPGKTEITRAAQRLERFTALEVLQIHGGLTLQQQSRVFVPGKGRRVILATNVAETSITIPGIGVVVDGGLVRRTRYLNGRGFLTLVAVARDSADQRAGRAGRTAPGKCYRLWNPEAVIEARTPPEIHREALAPLLLATAACGSRLEEVSFLDPPMEYAVEAATEDLVALGAVDRRRAITERGRRLFGLPLDATLGNLLIESERAGCLEDAIDLVSALAVGRPIFDRRGAASWQDEDLRSAGCDAVAHIRAVREGQSERHAVNRFAVDEARVIRHRLRQAWNLPPLEFETGRVIDREALASAALKGDARCVYVVRRRRGRVRWSNGGTEIETASGCAVDVEETEAIAVLANMAVGVGYRDSRIYATCAMPLRLRQLVEAGLGRDCLGRLSVENGTVVAVIERVYAGRVIEEREEVPRGDLARVALVELAKSGMVFRETMQQCAERLEAAALLHRLWRRGLLPDDLVETGAVKPEADGLESWLLERLAALGLESGSDLALLSGSDLLVRDLDPLAREWLDRQFPRELRIGDASYRVEYELGQHQATFVRTSGNRRDPPPLSVLPSLRGFRIRIKHHSKTWVLRDRH